MSFLQGERDGFFFGLASFLPYYLMVLTTVITIISLARYLITNSGLFRGPIPLLRPKGKTQELRGDYRQAPR